MLLLQGLELVDLGAAEQSGVHFEIGVFRGGADQNQIALLHRGEQHILLGLVQALDLVHKEDRPLPMEGPAVPSLFR